MRRVAALALATTLLAPVAALAGPGHGDKDKCTASTQECLDQMLKQTANRGWIGIELEPLDSGAMKITRVVEKSPAEAAGLKAGDVLVALEGLTFGKASESDLDAARAKMTPGTTVTYTVARSGSEMKMPVKLAAMPEQVRAQMIGMHMMEHANGGTEMADASEGAYRDVPIEEVAKLIKNGKVHVFDANGDKTRHELGTLPTATLLTSSSEYDLSVLPKDKSASLLFYCANTHCTACETAAKRASGAGYKNITVMRAGIMGWSKAGQATTKVPQT